jgi:GTPase
MDQEACSISTTAVTITGSVDSGKSTFIGVLAYGELDDGRGSARKRVAKHQHERDTGRTSDISVRSIKIPENNTALTIIDLCGHEHYFHTTTYGLSGYYPDYAFLIVSANRGVLKMTEQHIRVLYSLCVPICVVVTHIDITPIEVYKNTKKEIEKLLCKFYGNKIQPFFTNDETHFHMVEVEFPQIKQNIADMEKKVSQLKEELELELKLELELELELENKITTDPDDKEKNNKVESMNEDNKVKLITENIESTKQKITEQKEYLKKKEDELIVRKNKIRSDVNHSLTKINGGKQFYFPIITISNKTGFFIDVAKDVIKNLPPRKLWSTVDEQYITSHKIINHFVTALKGKKMDNLIQPVEPLEGNIFYIDTCFSPPGVGLVITGINRGSDVKLGNVMYIGPVNNRFIEFHVRGMHNNVQQSTSIIKDHWRATINMSLTNKKAIKRNQIRKGMIAVSSPSIIKNICYRCEAIMTFFSNSVTIKSGYSPVIHMGTIRQTVKITVDPDKNNGSDVVGFSGKSGNFAIVTMKFLKNPEYVEPYSVFLIRNGEVHGIGMILNTTSLDQDSEAAPDVQKRIRK